MNTYEIIAYYRSLSEHVKKIRMNGQVPAVLYGRKRKKNIYFTVPMILLKKVVYTTEVYRIKLNIEGDIFDTIIKEVVFHPVSEMMLHVDFLEIYEDVAVNIEIPLKYIGVSPGIQKGGSLVAKLRKLSIKALPEHIPNQVDVNISSLELGKSIKVKSLKIENVKILNNPLVTMASVEVPRTLRVSSEGTPEEAVVPNEEQESKT